MTNELQLMGVGFLLAIVILGILLLILWFYRHSLMLLFMKRKINKAAEIFKTTTAKDETELQIETIKKLREANIINPLLINEGIKKMGGINYATKVQQQENTGTAAESEPRPNNARESNAKRFRTSSSIKPKFARKDNLGDR